MDGGRLVGVVVACLLASACRARKVETSVGVFEIPGRARTHVQGDLALVSTDQGCEMHGGTELEIRGHRQVPGPDGQLRDELSIRGVDSQGCPGGWVAAESLRPLSGPATPPPMVEQPVTDRLEVQ